MLGEGKGEPEERRGQQKKKDLEETVGGRRHLPICSGKWEEKRAERHHEVKGGHGGEKGPSSPEKNQENGKPSSENYQTERLGKGLSETAPRATHNERGARTGKVEERKKCALRGDVGVRRNDRRRKCELILEADSNFASMLELVEIDAQEV